MDDANFSKQAYRGTGCQRGSREGVTVSIQVGRAEAEEPGRTGAFAGRARADWTQNIGFAKLEV